MVKQLEQRKIAFVGTCCIGKTTLLEYFKKKFLNDTNFGFVEEAARMFFLENPQIIGRFSTETQAKIQKLAMKNERIVNVSNVKIIFCDRSVVDAVVYARAFGDIKNAKKLYENIASWLITYNKFLLLDPKDVPYQTDDIRQETKEERQKLHNAFLEFFREKDIPFELISGTPKQRIKRVEEIIKS